MTKPRFLVTGGTGFLGKHVVTRLREWADVDILSRKAETNEHDLQGDLTRWNAGLVDLETLKRRNYQMAIHMAGHYDLRANIDQCCLHNTFATSTLLKVAKELQITKVIQTSSVAAAINIHRPLVATEDQQVNSPFPDAYSESKAQSEKIFFSTHGPFTHRINLRLGILVGDSQFGGIERIDGPYYLAEVLKRYKLLIESCPTPLILPGDVDARIPLVPVDAAAKAINQLARYYLLDSNNVSTTLHLTPNEGLGHLQLYTSALKHLIIRNKGVILRKMGTNNFISRTILRLIQLPQEEFYYFMNMPRFEVQATTAILGNDWCPEFSAFENEFWRGYEKYISNS